MRDFYIGKVTFGQMNFFTHAFHDHCIVGKAFLKILFISFFQGGAIKNLRGLNHPEGVPVDGYTCFTADFSERVVDRYYGNTISEKSGSLKCPFYEAFGDQWSCPVVNCNQSFARQDLQGILNRMEAGFSAGNQLMRYIESIFPAKALPVNELIGGQYKDQGNFRENIHKRLHAVHHQWLTGQH